MSDHDPVRGALQDGWHRSLRASSVDVPGPWHVRVWRRYRWWIVSTLLFVLFEVALFALGGSSGGHL